MTESQHHQLRQGVILNNKYRIEKVLGEGGFGITYLALDMVLELPVAIKEYYLAGYVTRETANSNTVMAFSGEKKELYEEGKKKFIKEARSLGKLAGQRGIVAVRDYFEENNTAYIVMEYLEGITLKGYLKQVGGKLTAEHTLELVEPVVKSLIEVHNQGIIHRDISPDNIMVLPGSSVKLLDFGAARETSINGEKSLSVLLKPGYAPEEQYRTRGEQGPWSDIYALCATVYRCITGKVPMESIERLRNDALKSPSALGISMDKEKEHTLMQGLSLFKEKRIQNAKELYEGWYGPLQNTVTGTKEDKKALKKGKIFQLLKKKKKLILSILVCLIVGFIGVVSYKMIVKKQENNISVMPGDILISSPLVAKGDEDMFLRTEYGLLYGIYDNEQGITEAFDLFSEVYLGDVYLDADEYLYMVADNLGLLRFNITNDEDIEYLVNDDVEDTFMKEDEFLYYLKANDSHLYRYSLETGKEKLLSDDEILADSFSIYDEQIFYYATESENSSGIYVYDLEKNKSNYLKSSDKLGKIYCIRSGSRIIYAVNSDGKLYTIHPGSYKISETTCNNICIDMPICPVEETMQKGFYYVDESKKNICFYDRTTGKSKLTASVKKNIIQCDYAGDRFFYVLEDGTYHYLTKKGVIRDFTKDVDYFKGGVFNEE